MNNSNLNWRQPTEVLRRLSGMLLVAALSLPVQAWAHSDEHMAMMKGPHGGKVRMAEMYHFELVVKDGEARVWLTDHFDKPQSTKGTTGSLRLINRNNSVSVNLAPTSGNELAVSDARIKAAHGTKLMLSVTVQGRTLQTRFSLDEH